MINIGNFRMMASAIKSQLQDKDKIMKDLPSNMVEDFAYIICHIETRLFEIRKDHNDTLQRLRAMKHEIENSMATIITADITNNTILSYVQDVLREGPDESDIGSSSNKGN